MRIRSRISGKERDARSRLAKLLHEGMLLKGSLVTMSRTCGKPNCKCLRGEKHVSLYLSLRVGKGRKMIYVPRALEETVRSWVDTHRTVEALVERISQGCLDRFLKAKQEGSQARSKPGKRVRRKKR